MRRIRREAALFLLAVQFLTRLPVPAVRWSRARAAASLRHHPLVGILIGAAASLLFWAAAAVWPQPVVAVLVVAATVWLTGALHEDGFADVCDGLGGGASGARALEVMRDSRIGAYGAAGLVLTLGARIAVLAVAPVAAVPWLLIAGQGASRASMVVALATGRYARVEGAATPVARGPGRGGIAWALGCGAAALLALGLAGWGALAGGAAGLVAGHLAMRMLYQRRLGGYTGDCLGAVQQTGELGCLLGALAWL